MSPSTRRRPGRGHVGDLPHPLASHEGGLRGYHVGHVGRQIHPDDFALHDLIIAMDRDNAADLERLRGGEESRQRFLSVGRTRADPVVAAMGPVRDARRRRHRRSVGPAAQRVRRDVRRDRAIDPAADRTPGMVGQREPVTGQRRPSRHICQRSQLAHHRLAAVADRPVGDPQGHRCLLDGRGVQQRHDNGYIGIVHPARPGATEQIDDDGKRFVQPCRRPRRRDPDQLDR